jgi:hypothetical protein
VQPTPLRPEEGRDVTSATNGDEEEDRVKFYPGHDKRQFSPVFQKFRKFAKILRLSTSYCHLFAMNVSLGYGSEHLFM